MSKVSTAQKLGVAARIAGRHAQGSRVFCALKSSAATTGRALGRVFHQLWLEVTGAVFLLIAASGAAAWAHEYSRYQAKKVGFGHVAVAICFTLTFAWFGVSSFWRVWQKGRR